MHVNNIIRLVYRSITKKLFVTVMLFCINFISFYMVDIVATSYFGTKYAINETTKMFSSDINNINYVCAGGTDATYEDGRKLTEYVEKLDEVEKSGYFSEGVAQGLDNDLRIPVVIADTKIQQIGNLKLSNKLKEAMQNVPQGYQCMLLGYNYKNKVNIGDIFSASIYKNDKCIVVGFLQKDAMWPKRGRLFDVSTGEDIYTLENSGIIITDNYELYDTSKVADTSYEYYFLVSDYNKDIVYDKIKAFASENSITALIVNIGENIQNKIEENGLSNNKNITATVMFVILATLSMSVSCVVHCMLDKKSYGTMVVCGMKKKEIIKMTVFYNGFLFISSLVASWLLRQKQIFGKINPADSQLVTGVFRLNNIAGHMYFVPILILVMIIFMTLITSVMPAIIISRMTPVDMIFERD